jgi:hypothetical protein
MKNEETNATRKETKFSGALPPPQTPPAYLAQRARNVARTQHLSSQRSGVTG